MELNSLISKALENSQLRGAAAAGLTDKLLTTDGVKLSASDQGFSEISVEDLASVMKSKRQASASDNLFVGNHGLEEKEDDKKVNSVDSSNSSVSETVSKTQSKIQEISKHSEELLDRRSEIFGSLKSVQSNPFLAK